MKKTLIIPVLLLASLFSNSQFIHKIKADSVLITNDSCNAELNLENSTKDLLGFLYNKGNGRTEFRKGLIKINDSLYIIGADTLNTVKGLSGSFIRNQNAAAQTGNAWISGTFRAGTFRTTTRLTITDDDPNIEVDVNVLGSMRTNYGSNGGAYHDFVNGLLSISRVASQKGGQLAQFSQTSTDMGSFSIGDQHQNDQYSGTIGTVNSYFIGTMGYVTPGHISPNNGIYGINLNFNNQSSANNPNAAWFHASNGTFPLIIKKTGQTIVSNRLSVGSTTGDALLQLGAGTSAANSAPLKFTSGTNLTTPENGAVEYDGTNYFVTSNTTRYILAKTLTTTATLNFGNTSAGSSTDLTITLTGAANGDLVALGVPNEATSANGLFTAWVSAANTITVRFSNNDLSNAIDPASGTFRVSITKY